MKEDLKDILQHGQRKNDLDRVSEGYFTTWTREGLDRGSEGHFTAWTRGFDRGSEGHFIAWTKEKWSS